MPLRRIAWVAAGLVLGLVLATAALAANPQFPGNDPNESVRIHTPDDPDFDQCEPHEPGEGTQTCTGVFNQEFERFGFAPKATENTATYKNPTDPHVVRLAAQNTLAKRNPLGQVSGVSADRAWKFSTGDPSVQVGIVDTGIEWANRSLRTKAWLNAGELPTPLHDRTTPLSDGATCASYVNADDANGDGAFNVVDYVCDSRVEKHAPGRNGDPNALDAQDLLTDPDFKDGVDDDGNGYVDDISGWDFFDDDNDAFDVSSYSTADGHGSGRAEEAAARTNDGDGGTAVCPRCQFVPLRAWDSFVLDTNNFGQAVTYAADNAIEVIEGAVGGLYNTRFNRAAFEYAYGKGVFFAIVSSDANTAAHNYPTVYNESLMIAGVVADQHGLSSDDADYPQQAIDFFNRFGIPIVPANAPVATWFRNSGLTQYGGHAGVVMPATTGSEGTGQASGAAGLLMSYGRQRSAADPLFGPPLDANEVKQILTLSAEDVVPENTIGVGVPDPAQVGWDQHFGYGRPDLGLAMEWIRDRRIPPQALITSPDWFAPLNVAQQATVDIRGRLSAQRAPAYTWKLQWAPGIEPCESEFQDVGAPHPETGPVDGVLGTINLTAVRAALDARKVATPDPACRRTPGPVMGGSTVDPTAPRPGPGDRDPNEPAFTVRVVVTAGTNRAEHRKTLFAYEDESVHAGWSKNIGAGGEASQRLFDLNGDNRLDIVQADSGGELHVYNADGTPLASFNGGQPVLTQRVANLHPDAPAYDEVDPPREVLRTPVIGDIDGDMEPEIVDSAGEHVYAWNADGTVATGFPVRIDPTKSRPEDRTKQNHVKRGFHASPSLGDFDGDGRLDIAVPGMDQHLYAWDGDGDLLPGFPRKLKKPGETNAEVAGAEAVTTASVGDIAGDSKPEIITPTNELSAESGPIPQLEPGANRIYAITGTGALVPGWPAEPSGPLPGIIPFFGPSVENALGDLDGDGRPETVGAITSGDAKAYGGDGEEKVSYVPEPVASSETVSRTLIVNTFEYPTVANLNGGDTLEVMKGGISVEGVANLLLVGQNQPYNHVMQAWDGESGNPVPAWPQVVEDYQWGSNPAVADVSDAPGYEVLAPTGLYTVRNLNAQGNEGAGWPKFTGGWNMATPAVGDADGDGQLEVAQISREGNAFLWDTGSPACGTNDEWWTSRHDEWNTGAHGTDTRPPGTPRALASSRSGTTVSLTWTAPGDDWLCGGARRYRVISSAAPIVHPTDGVVVGTFDTTKQAGEAETRTLTGIASGHHVAVLYQDDAGNWGHLRSVDTGFAGPGNAVPTCADLGPLTVTRDEPKPVDLVCADADGTALTLSIVDEPEHGSLGPVDQSTGRVVYTPDPGYTGPDDFTYRASDGTANSAVATVTLLVAAPPNRAPSCRDIGPVSVEHGKAKRIALACTDPDGDSLTLTTTSRPAKGTLSQVDQSSDSVVYTPNPGASGDDEFTYRANDARTDSPSAKVTLRIAAAPVAGPAAVVPEVAAPPRAETPVPIGPGAPPVAAACRSGGGFASVRVVPRRRGALLAFRRRVAAPVQVDVFQQSIGRRVIGERLVARFSGRARSVVWNGRANRPGRRVSDGYYFVRFRIRVAPGVIDYRRVPLRRVRGRFAVRRSFYRRETCGLLRSYKLTRPVFGGRTSRALGLSYQLNADARVRVEVLRGSRVVRRFPARSRRARTTYRLRFPARGRPAGEYRFRITVTRGATTERSTLTARRL